jgi:signal transduction histidine kinase
MIVSSDDRVIGTVEAGYSRRYRKYIYERDVQILQGVVDYAVRALERRRRELLERINHEFKNPIVGIRNNASFLRRRVVELSDDQICQKLDDISTDSEILLYQLENLGYILGRPPRTSKRELTLVYRDIIIKTINQLKPLIAERRFDISRAEFAVKDAHRVKIYVDKAKLNQVVYNILMNSIKYAEKDPDAFQIQIALEETANNFIFKFKDWGIGIKKEFKEKVFEDGFRAPEAINRFVTGSGLGLTIARETVRELGGDLILANNGKPTEFHLVLPKSLEDVPDDSIRG